MARDVLAEATPRLGSALEPGEVLRDVVPVSLTLGEDQLVEAARAEGVRAVADDISDRTRRQGPPPSGASRLLGKLGSGIADFVTGGSPLRATGPDLPNPNGKALVGFPGCLAVRLRDQLAGDKAERLLAATDRRVIVLDDPLGEFGLGKARRNGEPIPPLTVVDSIPPAALRGVARRPVQLSRGRLEIFFADGSMLAVDTGIKAFAEKFVAAVPTGA